MSEIEKTINELENRLSIELSNGNEMAVIFLENQIALLEG